MAGLFLFLTDRFIKLFIFEKQTLVFSVGDYLHFEYMKNPGIAFGMPLNFVLLLFLYIIIIVVLVFMSLKRLTLGQLDLFSALFFIIVGAFSNLIDRIRFGFVIDYIYLKNFSVFNLADIMITLGAISFLLLNFFKQKNDNNS